MNVDINIKETSSQISVKILKALSGEVDKYFQQAFNRCKRDIVSIVSEAITSHRTYQSLTSGKLRAEFGLDSSSSRLSQILRFWENLEVEYKKPKIKSNQIIGSFSLSMIQSDYSDVLSSAAAVVNTEKGSQLEWLRWLLLFGDKEIIKDYDIKFGSNPRSRSGNAIMVGKTGSRWGVPSSFAGTANKNWITEAIDSVEDQVFRLLEQSLRK
jgi:hypothetical protein|tara:strand:- start:296 stop:931 length:636 start_codon:yes stop_codon:yes gene_type:complete